MQDFWDSIVNDSDTFQLSSCCHDIPRALHFNTTFWTTPWFLQALTKYPDSFCQTTT